MQFVLVQGLTAQQTPWEPDCGLVGALPGTQPCAVPRTLYSRRTPEHLAQEQENMFCSC